MHYFTSKNNNTIFGYNGDYSGDIEIVSKEGDLFKVDGFDLLEFAEHIAASRIIEMIEEEFM